MRRIDTFFVTAAVAILLLTAIGTASARNLRTSQQSLTIRWASLIFESSTGATVSCPVTLEGSFHRATLAKVMASLVGYITGARAGAPASCNGGEMTFLTGTLPWHLTYEGFTGALPTIRTVRLLLLGAALLVHWNGSSTCLARSEARNPMHLIATLGASGRVESLENEAGTLVPLSGALCFFFWGRFQENPSIFENGSGSAILITLI
jgi:hypothetical protein